VKDAFSAAARYGEYTKEMDDARYPCISEKPLTAGEAALVKSIFGDSINTDKVRKYITLQTKPGNRFGVLIAAQVFNGDSIKFYGPKYASADYSKDKDFFLFGLLIHEMTHIWQQQNKVRNARPAYRAYEYTLTKRSQFKKFGQEQQASIIEDYARQFLFFKRSPGGAQDNYLPNSAPGLDAKSLSSLTLLAKVVEEQFPEARKTRLALEAQRKNPPTPGRLLRRAQL